MTLTLDVTLPAVTLPSYIKPPLNWMESGTELSVSVTGAIGDITWTEFSGGTASRGRMFTINDPGPALQSTIQIGGRAFGQAMIMATDSTGNFGVTQPILVGSVIIAGADGSYLLVFPDGTLTRLELADVAMDIQQQAGTMMVFADVTSAVMMNETHLTQTPPRPASTISVTCYLLNLNHSRPK